MRRLSVALLVLMPLLPCWTVQVVNPQLSDGRVCCRMETRVECVSLADMLRQWMNRRIRCVTTDTFQRCRQ
jgi:hypothetical protein